MGLGERGRTRAVSLLAAALAIAVLARGGLTGALTAPGAEGAALVSPFTGLALALVLLAGPALALAIFVGTAAAWLAARAPLPLALGVAAGQTLEALVAAAILHRCGFSERLARVRDVGLLLAAAAASAFAGAAAVVLSLILCDVTLAPFAMAWRNWWLGDVTGILVGAPLVLAAAAPPTPRAPTEPGQSGEGFFAGVVLIATTAGIFARQHLPGPSSVPPPFLLFLPIMWIALRFGPRARAAAVLLVASAAVAANAAGLGPFTGAPSVPLFVSVMAGTALMLGAFAAENARPLRVPALVPLAPPAEAPAVTPPPSLTPSPRRTTEFTTTDGPANDAAVQVTPRPEPRADTEPALSALRARDEFLYIAGHELRTPLCTVVLELGSLERLCRKSGVDERILGRVTKILSQTDRLTQLMHRLLEVSRMQNTTLALHCERFDLTEMARDVLDRFGEQAQRAGSTLELVAPLAVAGTWDKLRLEQVLTNLVGNAIKYGSGKPIVVTLASTSTATSIAVRDGGIGVARDDAERIFEPFERGVSVDHSAGFGLGLYISRKIVEAHGGTIAVSCTPGQGATFSVQLPPGELMPAALVPAQVTVGGPVRPVEPWRASGRG